MNLPKQKPWNVKTPNKNLVNEFSKELGISSFLSSLLINRGIEDLEAARKYLFPKFADLHDPFLLPNMDKAVDRIERAIKDQESILIYGDMILMEQQQ